MMDSNKEINWYNMGFPHQHVIRHSPVICYKLVLHGGRGILVNGKTLIKHPNKNILI